jgi:ankyrin repeat protein
MDDGATPLLNASFNGHVEAVRDLLFHGANPRAATTNGDTALFLATVNGHKAVAKLLRAALK